MKKNKNGFTLIELLAIIVILAVISVITVPLILNIIDDAKKGAVKSSFYGYKKSINNFYASRNLSDSNFKLNGEFTIDNDGNILNEDYDYFIDFSGKGPTGGYLSFENGFISSGCVQFDDFYVVVNDDKVSNVQKGKCPDLNNIFQIVSDSNPGVICGDGSVEDYDNSDVCYIYSVEDLVAFSNMVNNGNIFSDKTVKLMNNLDILNENSYSNSSTTSFGDFNNNGSVSSLIRELTDRKFSGFKPIGNVTNKFSGVFEGNAKVIKNMYINYSNDDYVGLFGYNAGIIRGLILDNIYVKGNKRVGGTVGYSNGELTSIIVNGDVSGNSTVGLVAGYVNKKTEIIAKGNVTGTGDYIGGLVGRRSTNNPYFFGVYQGGSVEGVGSNVHKVYGDRGSATSNAIAISLDSATVNGTATESSSVTSVTGYTFNSTGIKSLAAYESILDTFVGGDNNEDGYYYDYDSKGKITVYSIIDKPLTITMSGDGSIESPYQINSYNDFKQISYNLDAYYVLNSDIDFSGKREFVVSDVDNVFAGNFNGNGKNLSNININGTDYAALFGYSSGVIDNVHLNNVHINGYDYSSGLVGYNSGNISGISIFGNVSGNRYVGGLVGYNAGSILNCYYSGESSGQMNIGLIAGFTKGNVLGAASGNVIGSGNKVGGLVGARSTTNPKFAGAYLGGYVSGDGDDVHRVYGARGSATSAAVAIANNSITVNGNTVEGATLINANGMSYSESDLLTSAPYESIGFNFSITDPSVEAYIWYFDNNELKFKHN